MARTITSFNGGLFSSYLKGRIELEKYGSALQDIENYHLMRYGALQNRAGFEHLEMEDYDTDARLIPFQYNIKQSYVLSFCSNTLKIMKNGQFLPIAPIASPYNADQLHDIQYVQVADVMYFTHPDTPVRKLTRFAEDDWRFEEVQELLKAPFLELNNSVTTLTPNATSGVGKTLTSNLPLFEPYHVGRTVLLKQTRTNNNTTTTGEWLPVNGDWNFSTRGSWSGSVTILISTDGGVTSSLYRTYGSTNGSSNYQIDGKETSKNAMLSLGQIPSGCSATLTINSLQVNGVCKITDYIDSKNVKIDILEPFDNTKATTEWAFNAFSDATGFPTGIAIYNDRLVLGGTYAQPSTLFYSALDEWEDFYPAEGALAPLVVKLNTSETIQWLTKERGSTLVGTSGMEFSVQSKSEQSAFGGDNIKVNVEGAEGSINIQSVTVSDVTIFVARDSKHVRTISYNFENDKLQSNDLCSLSGVEFLESGIREMNYKQNPTGEIYFVLNNGELAILTYDKEQNIYGWSRFVTDGDIKSCCVLRNGIHDELYIAVERTNGAGDKVVSIERMADRDFKTKEDWYFFDFGKKLEFYDPTHTISGLDYLNDMTVTVMGDGDIIGKATVYNGSIELPRDVRKVSLGIPYASYAQVMDIDSTDGRDSNVPQRKKHNKLWVKVRNTCGLESGDSRDNLERIKIHGSSGVWLKNIEPITDTITINIDARHKEEFAPYFAQTSPFAQEILGYASSVSIGT